MKVHSYTSDDILHISNSISFQNELFSLIDIDIDIDVDTENEISTIISEKYDFSLLDKKYGSLRARRILFHLTRNMFVYCSELQSSEMYQHFKYGWLNMISQICDNTESSILITELFIFRITTEIIENMGNTSAQHDILTLLKYVDFNLIYHHSTDMGNRLINELYKWCNWFLENMRFDVAKEFYNSDNIMFSHYFSDAGMMSVYNTIRKSLSFGKFNIEQMKPNTLDIIELFTNISQDKSLLNKLLHYVQYDSTFICDMLFYSDLIPIVRQILPQLFNTLIIEINKSKSTGSDGNFEIKRTNKMLKTLLNFCFKNAKLNDIYNILFNIYQKYIDTLKINVLSYDKKIMFHNIEQLISSHSNEEHDILYNYMKTLIENDLLDEYFTIYQRKSISEYSINEFSVDYMIRTCGIYYNNFTSHPVCLINFDETQFRFDYFIKMYELFKQYYQKHGKHFQIFNEKTQIILNEMFKYIKIAIVNCIQKTTVKSKIHILSMLQIIEKIISIAKYELTIIDHSDKKNIEFINDVLEHYKWLNTNITSYINGDDFDMRFHDLCNEIIFYTEQYKQRYQKETEIKIHEQAIVELKKDINQITHQTYVSPLIISQTTTPKTVSRDIESNYDDNVRKPENEHVPEKSHISLNTIIFKVDEHTYTPCLFENTLDINDFICSDNIDEILPHTELKTCECMICCEPDDCLVLPCTNSKGVNLGHAVCKSCFISMSEQSNGQLICPVERNQMKICNGKLAPL